MWHSRANICACTSLHNPALCSVAWSHESEQSVNQLLAFKKYEDRSSRGTEEPLRGGFSGRLDVGWLLNPDEVSTQLVVTTQANKGIATYRCALAHELSVFDKSSPKAFNEVYNYFQPPSKTNVLPIICRNCV